MHMKDMKFDSKLIHGATLKDEYGNVNIPIHQTSTFRFKSADHGAACFAGESDGYVYTRLGNPTINALESVIADLENGYKAIAVSSGMAAVNIVYFAFLNQGDHILCHDAIYGASRGVIENHYKRFGVESTFINTTRLDLVEASIQPNTKMILIETPANPTMDIVDIKAIADIAHAHNVLLVVDNTFCSPYLQKPLDLGADIVFHSMTKYLNGHADIIAGVTIAKTPELYEPMFTVMYNLGCNMDPFQAYQVYRGMKTLSIRVEKAQENAMKVAEYLEQHPKVSSIKYPGLTSHPQYELGKKQMKGPGSMISFELTGGLQAGKQLMDHVQLLILAVSLGGVESLIQHPASMTHSKYTPEARAKANITDGLIRLSVGIEDVDDIIVDLEQALTYC